MTVRPAGGHLTQREADSLAPGTELMYRDKRSSTLQRVKVKEYQQIGSAKVLVVELEDGSKRSPLASTLFWPLEDEAGPEPRLRGL
jgi:hypothetical protein